MLRGFFVRLSKASWAQRLATSTGVVRRVSRRFVAGETETDALGVARELNQAGMQLTLDHLGEHTSSPEDARQAVVDIIHMLEEIERNQLRSGMSIKLSQIGLGISEELCRKNLLSILQAARQQNNFIRIDMEESALVDATLDTYCWARKQDFENVGVVIQSALYRSEEDVHRLLEMNARIRLVKGAYQEPLKVAYPKKADVDANYDRLVTLMLTHNQSGKALLLSPDGRVPPLPAIATHDPNRIAFAQGLAQRLGLQPGAMEFQMLYGIRRDLQERLTAAGYPVRIYVPYGSHWYPYLMRRLGERPANVWFVLSNFFRP